MGSICDVADEVIDYLNARGEKVGIVKVRLYRPWVSASLLKVLPETTKKIAVLDRTKEPGSLGEPLYWMSPPPCVRPARTTSSSPAAATAWAARTPRRPSIFAVYTELAKDQPKERFTLGHHRRCDLPVPARDQACPHHRCRRHQGVQVLGLGGDGTVGANKNSVKIIGDHTDKYVQAYFQYDSKKTGGVTISHLRFGDKPSAALLHQPG